MPSDDGSDGAFTLSESEKAAVLSARRAVTEQEVSAATEQLQQLAIGGRQTPQAAGRTVISPSTLAIIIPNLVKITTAIKAPAANNADLDSWQRAVHNWWALLGGPRDFFTTKPISRPDLELDSQTGAALRLSIADALSSQITDFDSLGAFELWNVLETRRTAWIKRESTYATAFVTNFSHPEASVDANATLFRSKLAIMRKSTNHAASAEGDAAREAWTRAAPARFGNIAETAIDLDWDLEKTIRRMEEMERRMVEVGTAMVAKASAAEDALVDRVVDKLDGKLEAMVAAYVGSGGGQDESCFYCKKPGHAKKDCRKRQRDLANKTIPTYLSGRVLVSLSVLRSPVDSSAASSQWLLDSGANVNLTGDRTLFVGPLRPCHLRIQVANDGYLEARHVGSISLRVMADDGTHVTLRLEEVYWFPTLTRNLLAPTSLLPLFWYITDGQSPDTARHRLVSTGSGPNITTRTASRLGLLDAIRPAPGLPDPPANPSAAESKLAAPAVAQTYTDSDIAQKAAIHCRLGHMPDAAIRDLVKRGLVDGLPAEGPWVTAPLPKCLACSLGKAKRAPFGGHLPQGTRCLERVHLDFFGPTRIADIDGNRFVLVLVDDKSRKKWSLPMQHRRDFLDAFKVWRRRVEREREALGGGKLETIRTDNAPELIARALDAYLKDEGIEHEYTPVYTSQLNGTAERAIGVVTVDQRVMGVDLANGSDALWGARFVWATIVGNARATNSVAGIATTPDQAWSGVKPDVSLFHRFGAPVRSWIPVEHRDPKLGKLGPSGRLFQFVGHDTRTGFGYRLFDQSAGPRGRIFVARPTECEFFDDDPVIMPLGTGVGTQTKGSTVETGAPVAVEHLEFVVPVAAGRAAGTDPILRLSNASGGVLEPPADAEYDALPGLDADSDDEEEVEDLRDVEPPENFAPPSPPVSRVPSPEPVPPRTLRQNPTPVIPWDKRDNSSDAAWRRNRESAIRAGVVANLGYDQDVESSETAGAPSANVAFLAAANLAKAATRDPRIPKPRDAMSDPRWRAAIDKEVNGLIANGTWKEVDFKDIPRGTKIINTHVVLNYKTSAYGDEIEKARLVADGSRMVQGVDFQEGWADVVNPTSVRTIFALINQNGWNWQKLDVKQAFLQSDINQPTFIRLPDWLVGDGESQLKELLKGLYGLRQSGNLWDTLLDKTLLELGFVRSAVDSRIYILRLETEVIFVLVHVDDMLLTGTSDPGIEEAKKRIKSKFTCTEDVTPTEFLGIAVRRDKQQGTLTLDLGSYSRRLLEYIGLPDVAPAPIPVQMDHNTIGQAKNEFERVFMRGKPYHEALGLLRYLVEFTRPDMSLGVGQAGRHAIDPSPRLWTFIVHLARYLQGTLDYGLVFQRIKDGAGDPWQITTMCDSDWAQNVDDRKSTWGRMTKLGNSLVSWKSAKGKQVATSSMDAEYGAVYHGVTESLFVHRLLRTLGLRSTEDGQPPTPLVYCDNQAAIKLTQHATNHNATKHIDVRFHYSREQRQLGNVNIAYKSSQEMTADTLTKGLTRVAFTRHRDGLGVADVKHATVRGSVGMM
jgi:transposase InsO family protein